MEKTSLQNNLSLLNYTQEWLDSGLLTEQILIGQVDEFKKGDDTNTEHYRYRLLHNYLKLDEAIEDEKLNRIISIIKQDADRPMASSAAIELLNKPYLNEAQFSKAKILALSFGRYMTRYVEKAKKKRLL